MRKSAKKAPPADGNPEFATVLKVLKALVVKLHASGELGMRRSRKRHHRG